MLAASDAQARRETRARRGRRNGRLFSPVCSSRHGALPFGPIMNLIAHFIIKRRRKNTEAATMLRVAAPYRRRRTDAN